MFAGSITRLTGFTWLVSWLTTTRYALEALSHVDLAARGHLLPCQVQRYMDNLPGFILTRLQPSEAGAAIVRGIEERAPRIFAPKWLRFVSALRGILNPLLDRRLERDAKMAAMVRDIEAATDEQGAAAASAAPR